MAAPIPPPRVVIEWRGEGTQSLFWCTVCDKAIKGNMTAAYRHRQRRHPGARTIIAGNPGSKLQHRLPGEEPRRKHRRIEEPTDLNSAQKAQITADAPGTLPPSTPYVRSAFCPAVVGTGAPILNAVVVSRVPGSGKRRIPGIRNMADGGHVAVTLVGIRLREIRQRFGAAPPASASSSSSSSSSSSGSGVGDVLEGPEWDIDVAFGNPAMSVDSSSATLAVAVALSALVLEKDVHGDVMIVGELDLRGNVLGVGDALVKIAGGMRSGMRKVLVPKADFLKLDLADPNAMDEQLRAYIVASVEPVDTLFTAIRHAVAGCEAGPAAEGAGTRVPMGYASLPGVVDHGRLQLWGMEACVVPGGKGEVYLTGGHGLAALEMVRIQQAITWAAGMAEVIRSEEEKERRPLNGPLLRLRQLLGTDGLHLHMIARPKRLQTWDVMGASVGLVLLSLAMSGRPLKKGHAVLGDFRADGALTGTVQGLSKSILRMAARDGWKKVIVPSSEAPRLRTDAYADERESRFTVQGANFLSAPMLRKLFTAASGGGA